MALYYFQLQFPLKLFNVDETNEIKGNFDIVNFISTCTFFVYYKRPSIPTQATYSINLL